MQEEGRFQEVSDIFIEAGEAHHRAFIKTDGADPEWPIWYAGYLGERLRDLLGAKFTKSELVYLLVTVEREMAIMAPGAEWPNYYARFFIERYL
jgi:NAD(P)H-hydrate epimerase